LLGSAVGLLAFAESAVTTDDVVASATDVAAATPAAGLLRRDPRRCPLSTL
jgi:hypothetical protein